MALKQSRRSISVSRSTYEMIKAYCESTGQPMSQFMEQAAHDRMKPALDNNDQLAQNVLDAGNTWRARDAAQKEQAAHGG
jgi:hypothetical protein